MAIPWIFWAVPMVVCAKSRRLPRGYAPRNDVFSVSLNEKSPGCICIRANILLNDSVNSTAADGGEALDQLVGGHAVLGGPA